jgi:hypothetical protein
VISRSIEEYYRKELRQQMNELADVVATGGASDWAQYKHITGQIAGLAWAERAFLDLVEQSQKEQEDD